jgi:acyl-coenzyme A synthetase/AMP-(fatty) acid ligase
VRPANCSTAAPTCSPALHAPELTRAALTPDGWLRSGDLAALNADGSVGYRGRGDELINKLPEQLVIVDQLPTTVTGKIAGARLKTILLPHLQPPAPTPVPVPEPEETGR